MIGNYYGVFFGTIKKTDILVKFMKKNPD